MGEYAGLSFEVIVGGLAYIAAVAVLASLLVKFVRERLPKFHSAKSESDRIKYLVMITLGIVAFAAALTFGGYLVLNLGHLLTCSPDTC